MGDPLASSATVLLSSMTPRPFNANGLRAHSAKFMSSRSNIHGCAGSLANCQYLPNPPFDCFSPLR